MSRNDSPSPPSLWVSVRRYCEIYEVDRKTVYKWELADLIVTWRVGRILRIRNQPPRTASPSE